ncbi:replication initiator protein [robinz microvirus RP_143]|nr:replication initiator protein [robinz microvirus RP_143]
MSCFAPITAWYSKQKGKTGRRQIVFSLSAACYPSPLRLPCGKCIGCRQDKARLWAMRVIHESKMHANNCFLTLTYDDKKLPKNGSLVKRDLQLFLKRLRKSLEPRKVRFYACAEYGSKTSRPHYHVLIFGWSPDIRTRVSRPHNQSGNVLYNSVQVSSCWPLGHSLCGDLSHASALYVANYATKKFVGTPDEIKTYYGDRQPEFALMSRRPGLGSTYVKKYASELVTHDTVIYNSKEMRFPRYYDLQMIAQSIVGVDHFEKLKSRRSRYKFFKENLPDRRRTREKYAELTHNTFKKENL